MPQPLRIAQVTPLYEAVPPRLYGGTERVVAHLTNALVELGCDVTLFASADAQTKARLAPVRDQAIRLDPAPLKSDLAAHLSMIADVRRRADQFDVIHFHTDMIHFPFFERSAGKTLTTLHGRLDLKDYQDQIRRDFVAKSVSEEEVLQTIADFHTEHDYILDPHTAVGVNAGLACRRQNIPMVCLATAHPAKFGAAVEAAIGRQPPIPESLAGIMEKTSRCELMDADSKQIKTYIKEHAIYKP